MPSCCALPCPDISRLERGPLHAGWPPSPEWRRCWLRACGQPPPLLWPRSWMIPARVPGWLQRCCRSWVWCPAPRCQQRAKRLGGCWLHAHRPHADSAAATTPRRLPVCQPRQEQRARAAASLKASRFGAGGCAGRGHRAAAGVAVAAWVARRRGAAPRLHTRAAKTTWSLPSAAMRTC